LKLDRAATRSFAEQFSWAACTKDFLHLLQPLPRPEKKRFWRRLRALRRNRPGRTGMAGGADAAGDPKLN
jgi:hypothetical protein